jgi:tetratricopeptide (TPR) repeat protein
MAVPASLLLLVAAGCATEDGPPPGVAEAQGRLEAGREAVRARQIPEAIDLFTEAVRANPDLAEAYYERGRCEITLRLDPQAEGDLRVLEQRALDDFSAAVRKNPAYGDAFFNRAMILASRAQYKLAADDLLNAIRFKPQDPEPHRWLGQIYEQKFEDRIVAAMEHYEKYSDLGGSDATIREKVRVWKDFKKNAVTTSPEPSTSRAPTAEDERLAQELHQKGLELLRNPDKQEAVNVFEKVLKDYGHTKYVQGRLQALQAAVSAFKKKDAPK